MDPNWRYRHGVRLTLRHLMILVLHVALMSAAAVPLARRGAYFPDQFQASLILAMAPGVLAVLVLVLDRPGPVRFWLAGLIASLTLPAVVTWADWLAWAFGAWPRYAWAIVILNALGLATLLRVARRLPGRCPACGLKSLLPLGRRGPKGLRWCASCGTSRRGE
jgi:hypothetical protein